MTLPEAYQTQVQYIQPSPKFQARGNNGIQAVPFPGYSVITPPWEDDQENQEVYKQLQAFQQQVVAQLGEGIVIPVPPSSFHLTLADLIWDDSYRHANKDPDFEINLRDRIAESFQRYQVQGQDHASNDWQLIGLIVRTRAIGVCLVPKSEEAYDRLVKLRRAIYQNSALMALGVEQQYHFTAHVTLGYFGEPVADADRDRIGQTLIDLNEQWLHLDSPQTLQVYRAELRKFDDMTRYYREPAWPVAEF